MDAPTAATAELTLKAAAADASDQTPDQAEPTAAMILAGKQADIASELRWAVEQGASLSRMMMEAFKLRRGPGGLTLSEYLLHRLWDRRIIPDPEEAARHVGQKAQVRMHEACTNSAWAAIDADKVLFHLAATGIGIQVPTVQALIDKRRRLPNAANPVGEEAIAGWLREQARYPIFMKPVFGLASLGAMAADSYDRATDSLIAAGQKRLGVQEVARRMANQADGYLIQSRLRTHPGMTAVAGSGVCCARLLILLRPAGPIIVQASLKVPAPWNAADNFWRVGNAICDVDVGSGTIRRHVVGMGMSLALNEPTPAAGKPMVGHKIPTWTKACQMALEAAPLLPGLGTQQWDIAITDKGPTALEVNRGGNLSIGEFASGRGALSDEMKEHLKENGWKG
jgi:hypothetical protein